MAETKTEVTVVRKAETEGELRSSTPIAARAEEIERFFARLMPRGWIRSLESERVRMPYVDVIDRDMDYLVLAEIPGVDKSNIEVSVNNHTLCIRGTCSLDTSDQKKDYLRSELSRGNFARNIDLPAGVDTASVMASLKDGVLEIVVPKDEHMQRHPVEVN